MSGQDINRAQISADLRALETQNLDELRERWRLSFGLPPTVRAADLLRRLLSERLQEEAYGRDAELQARLRRLAASAARGERPKPRAPTIKPGTQLIREWNGRTYRVEVNLRGFEWEGRTYDSLSEIARSITGTRWNGPMFFGLRTLSAAAKQPNGRASL